MSCLAASNDRAPCHAIVAGTVEHHTKDVTVSIMPSQHVEEQSHHSRIVSHYGYCTTEVIARYSLSQMLIITNKLLITRKHLKPVWQHRVNNHEGRSIFCLSPSCERRERCDLWSSLQELVEVHARTIKTQRNPLKPFGLEFRALLRFLDCQKKMR